MDKKKIIAAIAAISLTTGVAGFATACGGEDEPAAPHNHTYSTEWTAGENTHWHESTCEHTGLKEEGSEAPHIDEDDDKLCDVCDYDMREVIVVTVAEVKGGTVTLDKTQPKYGDTVTATVQANTGYIFKSVKLGEEVKTLDENGNFTFTATTAVTITAEFEGKTIALDTSAVETAKGTVAFKFPDGKTEYKFGENVMLEVTTDDYYRLSALYINGDTKVNYADSISNEGLVLVPNCEYEKLTITAEFIVGYRDITVNFKGRRMGVENIMFDADCGLTVSGYSDITIQDSATTLIKAEVGKSYNVSVPNGWQSASFKVGDADEYDVTLEWAPKLRYPEHSSNMDLSHFNDGYITSTSDMCDLGLYTEAFIGDNAMLTVNFSSKDFSPTNDYSRQFVSFMFERNDKWYAKNIGAHLIFEGATASNNRLEWNGNGNLWDSAALINGWTIDGNYCNPLSSAMLAKYMSDAGIDLTVVRRNGNEFLVFLDGMFVGSTTIGEDYIGKLASPMIVNPRLTNGNRIDYSFTEDKATIDKFLTSTVKVSENCVFSEGVSVTAAKASDAFKEAVTLTVTVPQGSVLTEFVVDGEDLLSGVTDAGVYTFTSWRKGGEHEFVIKAIAMDASESIDQTVKMNVADGTKVRFVRSGETTVEKTFEDGEVTFNGKVGAWKVQIFGFNTWLNVGSISVNGAEKTLDVGSIFNVGAASASGYVYDLAAGTMTWHGKSRPDMRLNVDHTVGQDMWIVTKVKLPAAALNQIKTLKGLGMSYGLGFKTAEKEVHIDLYSEDATHSYLMVDSPWGDAEKLGYWSDFLHGTAGDLQNGKYADAMVGDGVYLIERYNATTGKTEYWAGEDLQTLTLVFTYNSFNTLGTGALITTAGIYGGKNWSGGVDANFDCTIGIGSTLEAALGVAGKTVAVNVTGDKSEDGSVTYCTVNVPEFTAGNTALIEITPSADYNIKSVKINNKAVNFEYDEVENKLHLSIDRFCYTTLDIQITAEEVVKVNVNATITAK
ncbi:MAG: hypothetical protein K2L54_00185, partial [Clostridiales bacterium]|nr:hypothetical protein [Clostridiales bacterium]